METILFYLLEKKFLFYIVLTLFVFTLLKLRLKPWWKIINLIGFSCYLSINMYWMFSNIYHDDGFRVSLLTSFVMLIHLAFILVVYFLAKEIREHSNS
jgi:hypothetical protein